MAPLPTNMHGGLAAMHHAKGLAGPMVPFPCPDMCCRSCSSSASSAFASHPARVLSSGVVLQVWREDAAMLAAWQRGATGFPLVDAGMRQLWATGWMQQSVRMVCAAFLTEYLSISWVRGCSAACHDFATRSPKPLRV